MKQMILIWGGEVFDTREEYLEFLTACDRDLQRPPKTRKKRLCDSVSHQYESIVLHMPNGMNADYDSWKIWFEKYLPYLHWEWVVLVWWSLGAMFLMRYLAQNKFPSPIDQIHLVAWERQEQWLSWFSIDSDSLITISSISDHIYIYHSEDDALVDFDSWMRLSNALPDAIFEKFETRWHFIQPAFPELLANIWIYKR